MVHIAFLKYGIQNCRAQSQNLVQNPYNSHLSLTLLDPVWWYTINILSFWNSFQFGGTYSLPLAHNSKQCYIFPPSAIQNPEQLLYFPPPGTGPITVMHNPNIRFRIHTSVIHPSLWYAVKYEGTQYTFPPSGTRSSTVVHIPSLRSGILYVGTIEELKGKTVSKCSH